VIEHSSRANEGLLLDASCLPSQIESTYPSYS